MTIHCLSAPGARLIYEVEGSGPTLLLIPGGASDSTIFANARELLSEYYTVVTYDPRGISRSPLDDTTPQSNGDLIEEHADDVQRLLNEIGGGPAYMFAHSSGSLVAMAHAVRHGGVHTLVMHEPTICRYLDLRVLAGPDLPTLYRDQGVEAAMERFVALMGTESLSGPPVTLQRLEHRESNLAYLFEHILPAAMQFAPDLDALSKLSTRIVVGVGVKSAGQQPHTSALQLARDLGLDTAAFPGDHYGFAAKPIAFAMQLRQILARPSSARSDSARPPLPVRHP